MREFAATGFDPDLVVILTKVRIQDTGSSRVWLWILTFVRMTVSVEAGVDETGATCRSGLRRQPR
jgi:hypothetical protein